MNVVAVLPARMGSSRFPGKPLAPILGRPMIEHVYRRVAECSALDDVVVATCDVEIADAVRGFGGSVVMTSDRHERASDRVAEAAGSLAADVIVMVQGDEPMTTPEMVEASLTPFRERDDVGCVNLTARIADEDEFRSRNTIKLVKDATWRALYMSRQPIPDLGGRPFDAVEAWKQVCVIPFTADALQEFTRLAPTPLEIAESIDMLRFLEHGRDVHLVESDGSTCAVDTPADLELVEALLRDDPLAATYL